MDEATFDAFYSASFARLVGAIYAMCGDHAEAQDCVQEAFVRAWDHRHQLDQARAPEAWVRTVAWRLAMSRWRRTRRAFAPPDRSRQPGPPPQPDIMYADLIAGLKQIPAEQRRAIVLHHLCDLSVAEVAEETAAPVGTVKARLSRGRTALAAFMSDEVEETNNNV